MEKGVDGTVPRAGGAEVDSTCTSDKVIKEKIICGATQGVRTSGSDTERL